MAPSTNSTMTLQQNRLRPTATRRIVPAIPLPYMQKRKQQDAALSKAREQATTPAPAQAPIVVEMDVADSLVLSSPDVQEPLSTEVNGSDENESEVVTASSAPSSPETPATPVVPTVEEQEHAEVVVEREVASEEYEIHEETADPALDTPRSIPSDGQSSISRSAYQLPPDFVPAQHQQVEAVFYPPDMALPHPPSNFNGAMQNPTAYGHPANGYTTSNSSSPAPNQQGFPQWQPQSAYQYPPEHGQYPQNGGYSQQNMPNMYHPMGPPPPPRGAYPPPNNFSNHGPGPNTWGPPPPRMAPNGRGGEYMSQTPAGHHRQMPSAPRSMHGSQASQNGRDPISNGHNEVAHGQPQDRADANVITPQVALSIGYGSTYKYINEFESLYIQRNFGDPTYADCRVSLCRKDGGTLVSIPGLRLLFAKSAVLKDMIDARGPHMPGDVLRYDDLVLVTEDRFITDATFWWAMKTLYGHPLLEPQEYPQLKDFKDTHVENVDHALGYAAAGHLLQLPSVIARGLDMAAVQLDFKSLEKALEFCLDGGLDSSWMIDDENIRRQPYRFSTYGPGVNTLIARCLRFLMDNFPADPAASISFSDVSSNVRLPSTISARPVKHSSRPSNIQFGDISGEDGEAKNMKILSKVLLNLPFHLLKIVLTSEPSATKEAWSVPSVRENFMKSVIKEREKHRLEIQAGNVPNEERQANKKQWESVGWKEEVVNENGYLTLKRTKVDFLQPETAKRPHAA